MGQRMVQLDLSYTGNNDGSAVLHVSQMPPNPAILVPGPAFIFVVVNGVPSIGVQVMIGSGQIEKQPILSIGSLPAASMPQQGSSSGSSGNSGNNSSAGLPSAAYWSAIESITLAGMLLTILL